MQTFDPRSTENFEFANFSLFWDSLPLVLTRYIFILLFLFLSFALPVNTPVGLFFLMLTLELFYLGKFKKYSPSQKLSDLKEGNLAKVFSLSAAKIYIASQAAPALMFSQIIQTAEGEEFLRRLGIDQKILGPQISKDNASLSADMGKVLDQAFQIALKRKADYLEPIDLLVGLFLETPIFKKLLFEKDLEEDDLENVAFWVMDEKREHEEPFLDLDRARATPGIAQDWISGYTLETEKYARDVTKKLIKGEISPYLVGREKEVKEVEEILARDKKKNVILVGEPGVGKETIVYALTRFFYQGKVFGPLKYKRVLELNVGDLLAGGEKGILEERLKKILDEAQNAGDVVLYIPNIENIAGAKGAGEVDITGILLPSLRGEKMQVIGTTTPQAYAHYIEARPTFSETFDKVVIAEPPKAEAVKIAEQAAHRIEKQKNIVLTYQAVEAAVKLSDRYMKDRVLPGKAIDLLDQAAVKASSESRQAVTEDDIVQLTSEKKGIPLEVAKGEEQQRLLKLEQVLHQRVVNQEEAIKAIAEALRRARAFVREEKRPIGVFLFLGPTGVGKTETAKALADVYFGGEEKMIRLDMSEFQTPESITKLIGSPPGYGEQSKGQLTEAVRNQAFSLILLDEMEKAHQSILQLFLQVFDDGRLTDSEGRTVDFTETLIIATSNAGAEQIREVLLAGKNMTTFKDELLDFLQKKLVFSPEFLNRFDEVVLYKPLSPEQLLQVANLMIKKVTANLSQQDIEISATPTLVSQLVKEGYDPVFGARPLRRVIQEKIESVLSEKILKQELKRGDRVVLDLGPQGEVVLQKTASAFAQV